jgi:protein tyrosine/serine phosphatase
MSIARTAFRGYAAALVLTLTLSALSLAQDGNHNSLHSVSIENFGRVDENYYRGAQPEGQDYNDLHSLGVKAVLDLQNDGEAGEQRSVEAAGMKFYRIGMSTRKKPSQQQVEEFLSIVNDPQNQPVYVHCHGGRHRTGVMTAVYRMTKDGWVPDRAFAEMKQYQFDKGFGHGALKSFVYEYPTLLSRTAGAARARAVGGSHQ